MGNILAVGVTIVIFIILLLIGLAIGLYILNSLGLYALAKNRGLDNCWLAWIPIINLYLIGELTGNVMWGIKESRWILVLAPFVIGFITMTGIGVIISFPLSIAYSVYYFMVLFRLYRIYNQNNAVLFLILAILFPVTRPIWIFIIRNKQPDLVILNKYINQVNESNIISEQNSNNEIVNPVDPIETTTINRRTDPYEIKMKHENLSDESSSLNEINQNIEEINKNAQKEIDENPKDGEIHLHL